MLRIKRLVEWLSRSWPILVLMAIFTIHIYLVAYFDFSAAKTNEVISLIAQIIGGLLVLYSIDSNIGILQGRTLKSLFIKYLKDFPLIRRDITIEINDAIGLAASCGGKVSITRNPQSVEEKLEYLQEQIDDVKRDLAKESKELNEKIVCEATKLNAKINETKKALGQIETKLEEVSIGGLRIQLFGVLLIIYGAFTSFLA